MAEHKEVEYEDINTDNPRRDVLHRFLLRALALEDHRRNDIVMRPEEDSFSLTLHKEVWERIIRKMTKAMDKPSQELIDRLLEERNVLAQYVTTHTPYSVVQTSLDAEVSEERTLPSGITEDTDTYYKDSDYYNSVNDTIELMLDNSGEDKRQYMEEVPMGGE